MINVDYDVSMNTDVHPETVFAPIGIIQCVPGTWENDKRYLLPCELLHTNISTEMTLEVT